MRIDVSSLLSIDVDAELRKLSQAQLQGPWQLPTELVRRAKAAQATQVHVQLHRHRIHVSDDGEGIPAHVLEQLVILLDTRKDALQRHQALTYLESHGAFALLALAGFILNEFHLETFSRAEIFRFRYRPDHPPEFARIANSPTGQAIGTTITIHHLHVHLSKARSWLIHACRFTPGHITLHHKPINQGFSSYLASVKLSQQSTLNSQHTLTGALGLRGDEEQAMIWLLQYGVLTGHMTSHKVPSIDAILDFVTPHGQIASAADLRAQAEALLTPLHQEFMNFILRMAKQLPQLPQTLQSRMTRQVVQVLDHYPRYPELIQIPLFPTVGTSPRWLSVAEIRNLAEVDSQGQLIVSALYPEQHRQNLSYLTEYATLVILDSASRSRLNELFTLNFRAPPQQKQRRIMWQKLIDGFAHWRNFSLFGKAYQPLADDELSAQEQHFLADLRIFANRSPHEIHHEIYFCRGSGAARLLRGRTYRLLIPRNNPTLQACQRAYQKHGKAWLYPAYLSLLEGQELPPPSLHELWKQNP